uniref:Uncharacterized protein n=1 Tax=Leptospira santarosai serovar Arenal str. MAVJ 401 TaxID=1049976 RepID=M6JUF5_9LEPT|nr:hypothetical protein LEP1GSC063_0498 [Leptospira santarosai serovar Arenal str. MAVJ 401]
MKGNRKKNISKNNLEQIKILECGRVPCDLEHVSKLENWSSPEKTDIVMRNFSFETRRAHIG